MELIPLEQRLINVLRDLLHLIDVKGSYGESTYTYSAYGIKCSEEFNRAQNILEELQPFIG